MWTASARRQYQRSGPRYASDLTDEEFALIEPLLPAAKRGGRRRTTALREVLNAILYLLRTGAPPRPAGRVPCRDRIDGLLAIDWRMLPLVLVVHAADIQDRDGLARVCRRVRRRFPWLVLVFADGGYQGDQAAAAAAEERLRLEIVKRPRDAEGFHLLPRPLQGLLALSPSEIG